MAAFVRHRIMSKLLCYDDDVEFVAYNDGETNLGHCAYEPTPWDTEKEVDEATLTKYISKIIVSQAIDMADGKNQDEDKIPRMYRYQTQESHFAPNFLNNTTMPRRKTGNMSKNRQKSRRSRDQEEVTGLAREAPPGSEVFMREGVQMVTLPLPLLKQYMLTEVDARVRAVHYFYEYRHELVCRDRASCITELLQAKDKNNYLLEDLRKAMTTIELLQNLNKVKMMSDASKESQRKRRKEKKKRKNDSVPAICQSETSRDHNDVTGSNSGDAKDVVMEIRNGSGDSPDQKCCGIKPEVCEMDRSERKIVEQSGEECA
ncbi:uncharacterized protein LOC127860159 [Dreissena polymorpha]|uniref:Uncharacterized protein n=1 Tax=Dreissena polymorpha TaxID=45954 RepID=A0A9D3YJH3_DREPO|nr:uncharacterized protein LOC127860159 [Dreissena polymorpha]KAH3699939.1 hypothetical protein DPMN_074900 [Dreissena polymorpha]